MTHHWTGYWEQRGMGRQPMEDLSFQLAGGLIRGGGSDIIGLFTFYGRMEQDGRVLMMKQYIGRHAVAYEGQYDGEGTIFGTWSIGAWDSGDFMLRLSRTEGPAAEQSITMLQPASSV
jgi:hypothetical protein